MEHTVYLRIHSLLHERFYSVQFIYNTGPSCRVPTKRILDMKVQNMDNRCTVKSSVLIKIKNILFIVLWFGTGRFSNLRSFHYVVLTSGLGVISFLVTLF